MLIGEVSRRSGVSTRMLRHYDALGLVTPTGRSSGGYREYCADDVRRLFHVESLRTLGLSLHDAKRALDDAEFAPAELMGDLARLTRRRIEAEQELLARLERVGAAAPEEWDDVLGILALLRALDSDSPGRRQRAILSPEGASWPADALVAALLAEEDANVAGALRWSLARASGRGLADLATGLDSDEVEVRRRAVAAIAAVPTDAAGAAGAAGELLRRALGDPDATVRDRAALALGSRGEADTVAALVEMIVDGRRDVEAAEVLGMLADAAPDVVDTLEDALETAADAPPRLRLTQALAEIPGPAARQALARLAGDGDRTIAATATAILDMLGRAERARRRV